MKLEVRKGRRGDRNILATAFERGKARTSSCVASGMAASPESPGFIAPEA